MSNLEALTLRDSPLPKVKVSSTVVVSILNSFMRRSTRDARVIGTLLGEVNDGVVTVTECFAVPFNEKVEEFYVAINQDYHKTMYAFHRRNNKKERIVGWYTTTTSNGAFIIDNSSLIHDFYLSECDEPIHLVVDTTLRGDQINTRGFYGKSLLVGDQVLANIFQEILVEVDISETEKTGLYHMIHAENEWDSSEVVTKIPNATERIEDSIEKLQTVMDQLIAYVDDVVSGKIRNPSREAGITMMNALNAFLKKANTLTESPQSAGLNTQLQEMMVVSYLSTLTQAQALISEKLNEIL